MNGTVSIGSRSSSKDSYDEHNDDPEDVDVLDGIDLAVHSTPRKKNLHWTKLVDLFDPSVINQGGSYVC